MRVRQKAWFAASVLLATATLGQETTPEVETVVVNVPPIEIASPDTRSLAVTLRLDLDNDQYLTTAELDSAIGKVLREIAQDQRRARSRDWLRQSRILTASSASGFRRPGQRIRPARDYSAAIDFRHRGELRELRSLREQVIGAGSELGLVSEDFHELFSHLSPQQRFALLEADVEGNNDGTVTVREFYLHNRRIFSKKTRFESEFGEEAYLEVLRSLGVL